MTIDAMTSIGLLYLAAVNGVALALAFYDKLAAIAGTWWRVPEGMLLVLSGIGGSAGVKLVALVWGHKRLRRDYIVSLNLIVFLQIGLVVALWAELGGWRERMLVDQTAVLVSQPDDRAMPRRFGPGS